MITVSRAIVRATHLNHEMIQVVLEDLNGAAAHRPNRFAMLSQESISPLALLAKTALSSALETMVVPFGPPTGV